MRGLLVLVCLIAAQASPASVEATSAAEDVRSKLSLPNGSAPVQVLVDFELYDINEIDSVSETFEITGILTAQWRDAREAFSASELGITERVLEGEFQFEEYFVRWYPQIVLQNVSGLFEQQAVQLRIQPDGQIRLVQKITAIVEVDLDLRAFPFDKHRLEVVFSVLGFEPERVSLFVPEIVERPLQGVHVPGWIVDGISLDLAGEERPSRQQGAAVLAVDVTRATSYIRRLITFPMVIIVLLSFSIFWMDKSSLGDRNGISFIGVLTGVAFQQTVVGVIPPVSYITLMHAFLFISFLVMAATVPVNLIVAALDRRGKTAAGDKVDKHCRWLFPTVYFGLMMVLAIRIL